MRLPKIQSVPTINIMQMNTNHNFVMFARWHIRFWWRSKKCGSNLVISDVCLLTFYSGNVTVILKNSHLTYNEPKEMLETVHQLILCPSVCAACQSQPGPFSAQIVDNLIEFNACGIFPLDLSTLRSIVAAAATYITIPSDKLKNTSYPNLFNSAFASHCKNSPVSLTHVCPSVRTIQLGNRWKDYHNFEHRTVWIKYVYIFKLC